ncbi:MULTISPECIES: LTA synthase family protein [unclassified Polaribacter]|uniref:LTA synthase family protein n=1 Tax=unclassified Polaribacter TaxID=196858 RepID=UPI0011BEBE88|nr:MULTISPECIES: LTA synthase family protein [unclassified Polaribacter]TXD51305.1 LTA synthase family protein [Polaribacter sp. IC063]TXD56594.1 LTA synthase family protein [Polaribacter sp. IC066]
MQLDISFAGYLSFIPFILIILSIFIIPKVILKVIKVYTFIVLIFITLLVLIDAGLYQAWGIRLDASLLPYLNTPELMISTVSTFQLVTGILAWFFISFVFIKLYQKIHNAIIPKITFGGWQEIPLFLILTAALIIPVRGGFQTIPVNQSNVYFSDQMFANHAAINCIWNFSNTITHKVDGSNPYAYFEDETALKIINKTKNKLLTADTDSILTTTKPNVILILWESLPAKVVGALGGEPTVTPNLNKLAKEGLLFTNFYANGDRTDKGLPAILSGYYPPTVERIMRMPNKTRSLPMLPKEMEKLGYHSSFYYGGDMNFGNMNTYIRNAGITDIIDGSEFDKKDWNSKWGAYDDVFLERFAKDLTGKQKEPFFKIALTLTSHEPYEIKGEYKFGTDTHDNKFRSAHSYTDNVIGNFIAFAKQQDWYKNTLIVIMSDHGHTAPKHEGPYFSPKKFRIPMLWLGGAVNPNIKEINNFSSQVDFSYTLLDLLKGDTKKFVFGKNIFNQSDAQFAHYTFNKGFGTISKNGVFLYDYVSEKAILNEGKNAAQLDSLGKAITQNAYQDFLDRK